MTKQRKTWSCEVFVLGKWVAVSTGWSAVEKSAYESQHPGKLDVRFV